jgi:hypothetical protein
VIEKNTLPLSHGDPTVPNQPLSVKTATFQPVQSASLAPMPVLVPVAANAPQPSAEVTARWLPPAPPDDASMTASATTVIGKSTLPLSRIDPTISNQPRSVKTITIHTGPVQPASVAPTPVLVPDAAAAARLSTLFVARWLPSVPPIDSSRTVVASPEPTPIVQSPAQAAPAFSEPAKLESKKIEAAKLAGARVELAKIETVNTSVNSQIAASSPKAPHAHDGWLIQIGAFDREDEAKQHLSMARLKIPDALATAHPLTERVQQGDKVLYRSPGSTKEPLRLPASISSEAIRVALRSKNRTKLESNYFEQVAAWSAGVAPAGWLVGWNILSNLRFWHKADIPVAPGNVRFWG